MRATTRRALAFAMCVSLLSVALWPVVVTAGLLAAGTIVFWGPYWGRYMASDIGLRSFRRVFYSPGLWKWEAWSLARWWLLFGVLTLSVHGWKRLRTRACRQPSSSERLRRLLLFAPWIFALELGFLVGVWIDNVAVVPEPATLFVSGWSWTRWLWRDWLVRGVVPTVLVGTLFFRHVACWRWPRALVAALILVPLALNLAVAWSWLWAFVPLWRWVWR
jgi:hypothetical protein